MFPFYFRKNNEKYTILYKKAPNAARWVLILFEQLGKFIQKCIAFFKILMIEGLGKFLEQVLLLFGKAAGDLHLYGDVKIAFCLGIDAGDALAAEAEGTAGLSAFGQIIFHLTLQGGNLQFSTQGGIGEADGDLAIQIGAPPLKQGMGAHTDADIDIAVGTAVAARVGLVPHR